MFAIGVPEMLLLLVFVVLMVLGGGAALYWVVRMAVRDGRSDPRP
ncbi:MAG: hypothetical protein ACR2FG_10165 [Marmoricola sp.]